MRTAILLAAGESRRFGENKLLYRIQDSEMGKDHMVKVAVRKFLEAGVFDEVVVVVGFEYGRVVEALADLDVKFVYNPDYTLGMSSSIISGIRRVLRYSRLVAIHPSDVPFVKTYTIRYMVNSVSEVCESSCILIPRCYGRGGHPIILTGSLIREVLGIKEAEQGLKGLISRRIESVRYLDVEDPGVILDIDSPGDILRAATMGIH